MTTSIVSYTIRRLGCAYWANEIHTIEQAYLALTAANAVVPGHVIIAEHSDGSSAVWEEE